MAERQGKSPLLTVQQAADYLNTSVTFVWRLRYSGVVPCRKFGRSIRFHIDDLDRYIEASREQPVGQLRRYSA